MSNTTKGIIALLISSLGFSLMAFFVKYSGDLPTVQKTFFRNFISMAIALIFVIYYKEKLFGHKENQGLLLLRSALGLGGVLLNFYVIDRMVLSDAEILNKMSPFFTILLCALFLKEYIRRYQMISIVIALAGAIFIIKPSMSSDTVYALLGLLGALMAAGAYTVLRVLGSREKFYTVVFYFSAFSTAALLPFFIYQYEPMTFEQWIMLILAGIFAAFGQFGLTIAYSFAPAREISIFFYSTIIFTALLSIFILGEVPDILSVIGYFIIFGASYYMYMKNRKPKESL
ncbi:DMT family transporter [Lacicoccus alkaliphilus]|uniref:EamA domain-containing membrane protein RarD n=1 Tax=Lacicoccus alkaliphilus DSM 16010 TaxID=1123231 RepID=A0A1M7F7E6_9BACL|nr:DMT family transporter [Salinicoccus alkaliphilus]SHL99587.1 EamA domain-containing membrane protein RarD [Salinicoccus alkaliphilus DSM 16010]